MPLVPFSTQYPGEFLNRTEDNFDELLDKLKLFYNETRSDVEDGRVSRRRLDSRFNYQEELKDIKINQKGISTEEVALEFNDMLSGCIRQHDPITAFNIIPSPLFDSIAGATLASLYNSNSCWDFISGKLCLYEKKIVRMLGELAGWSDADGFVITGGKQAIAYAIKNGIGRATTSNRRSMGEYVVFCSAVAHYSIEHVCNYLGISAENCVRVSANATGEMDVGDLKKKLENSLSQGKKIAAVIAVAGGTINLIPDPILLIKQTIDQVKNEHHLEYTPYLHVDSVITWAWLAFQGDFSYLLKSHPQVAKKIRKVLSKLIDINCADSFAADFHKTGFCPYAAGVFITKESTNLLGITSSGYLPPEDPCFGELEPFRQTFENSRSGISIVSIWIAIRRMGVEGLRQFITYQLEVCETFKQKIREKYSEHFEVLNEHSNGWEIVLKPHFKDQFSWDYLQEAGPEEQQGYITACYAFVNHSWYSPFKTKVEKYPVIGFIPKYSRKGIYEKSFPAFLIHPTSLHYDEKAVEEMLESICNVKTAFDLHNNQLSESSIEEYLHAMVPPR